MPKSPAGSCRPQCHARASLPKKSSRKGPASSWWRAQPAPLPDRFNVSMKKDFGSFGASQKSLLFVFVFLTSVIVAKAATFEIHRFSDNSCELTVLIGRISILPALPSRLIGRSFYFEIELVFEGLVDQFEMPPFLVVRLEPSGLHCVTQEKAIISSDFSDFPILDV